MAQHEKIEKKPLELHIALNKLLFIDLFIYLVSLDQSMLAGYPVGRVSSFWGTQLSIHWLEHAG
jgi:hypothetical protein